MPGGADDAEALSEFEQSWSPSSTPLYKEEVPKMFQTTYANLMRLVDAGILRTIVKPHQVFISKESVDRLLDKVSSMMVKQKCRNEIGFTKIRIVHKLRIDVLTKEIIEGRLRPLRFDESLGGGLNGFIFDGDAVRDWVREMSRVVNHRLKNELRRKGLSPIFESDRAPRQSFWEREQADAAFSNNRAPDSKAA
jgi:hypothetical protein